MAMLIPELFAAEDRLPDVATDELLVVLGPPGRARETRAAWIRGLIETSVAGMRQTQHYAALHFGFVKPGVSPYVVVEWTGSGANALERRWVMQRLAGSLGTQYNLKKVAVFLESGATAAEVVLAEDLLTRTASPRYESSALTAMRLLTPDVERLRETDPFYKERLTHQLAFRSWVNENPDQLTSIELGLRLEAFCKAKGASFESFDVARLTELGMNLLLAVGQASDRSPSRLHLATHKVKPGDKPLLLVGKGITFDTGGINLKPHESFVNCMKNDMGGAGLMTQLFMALVETGYPGPLALAIPCCENLIDARAVKPGAIIKSAAGKDVIIEHTDAEGRLILADALHYAQKRWQPPLTLIAATLTTASLRQFTNFYTAVHFAGERFREALTAAGRNFGEEFSFWGEFLPFLNGNRTNAADLTNMGRMPSHASMGGGSNVAAHFLKEFAVRPIVHLDIFATTWNWSGDYPGAHYGATGAPFNALFQCVRSGTDLWGAT